MNLKDVKGELDEEKLKLLQTLQQVQYALTEPKIYEDALAHLEMEIKKLGEKPYTKALSKVLKAREGQYGIGNGIPIFTGILSAEDFQKHAQSGKIFKDVGAGVRHGEHAHRIQWYVLLFYLTEGFNKSYPAADLLKAINNNSIELNLSAWPEGSQEFYKTTWDALFDRAEPTNDDENVESRIKEFGITQPETLTTLLLRDAWLSKYPKLGKALEMRASKRTFDDEIPVTGLDSEKNFDRYKARKLESEKYKHNSPTSDLFYPKA